MRAFSFLPSLVLAKFIILPIAMAALLTGCDGLGPSAPQRGDEMAAQPHDAPQYAKPSESAPLSKEAMMNRPAEEDAASSKHRLDSAPPATNGKHQGLHKKVRQRLSMPRILAIATARVAGEVLEVEFDERDEDDRPEYEVKILTPDGLIIEMEIDAISGKILKIEED